METSGKLLSRAKQGLAQGGNQIGKGKTCVQRAKEMTVLYQKQRRQVKYLVARHQSGVMPCIDPAQSLYW
ncbi:hypothetical protein [Pseudomonas sediminis]|uniref:hypothetical protein n=1 Tax=Pseudomonas sediminis TaxID=1691904 RepID=UPI00117ADB80